MSKNSEESEEKRVKNLNRIFNKHIAIMHLHSLLPKGTYSTVLLFYKKLIVKGKRRNTLMLRIKHRQKSDDSFYAIPIPYFSFSRK